MSNFSLGAATVEIRAEFAKFRDDLNKAKRETGDAADRMKTSLAAVGSAAKGLAVVGTAAAAAGAGLFVLVRRAAQAAEDIADMSDKVGVSAERLQELRFAFTQNGAAMQDVDSGLSRLNAGLGAFVQNGTGPAVAGLKALGITTREAAAALGPTEQAFDEIVNRLAAMEDPARRAGVAAQLFGEEAGPKLAILIGKGGAEVDNLAQKARDLGLVLREDAVRQAAALSAQLRALADSISTRLTGALIELTPQIAAMAESFANSLPVILQWIEATGRFFGLLDAPIGQQLAELREELNGLNNVDPRMRAIGWVEERRTKRIAEIREEIAALEDRQRVVDEMLNRANTPAEVVVPPLPPGSGPKEKEEKEPDDPLTRATSGAEDRIRDLRIEAESFGMAKREAEAYRLEQDLLRAAAETYGEVSENMRGMIGLIVEDYQSAGEAVDELAKAQKRAEDAAKNQAQAMETVGDAIAGAAVNARSFGDVLKGLLPQLLALGVRGIFGGGPLGGVFNDALGVESGGILGSLLNADGNAFARGRVVPFAQGGVIGGPAMFPMAGGRTGIMGEAGPEAIMPLKRGADGKLGVAGGGGATTINVDARGATDPNAVEAAARRGAAIAMAQVPSINRDMRRRGTL